MGLLIEGVFYRFQYFKRDADELESWIYEKLQAAASDEGFKDVTNLQAKIQKHQVSGWGILGLFRSKH